MFGLPEDESFKRLRDDMRLSSRFTKSEVISSLAYITNEYGAIFLQTVMAARHYAETVLEWAKAGTSEKAEVEVAKGITVGYMLGRPVFGNYGEQFLKSVIPGYKKAVLV